MRSLFILVLVLLSSMYLPQIFAKKTYFDSAKSNHSIDAYKSSGMIKSSEVALRHDKNIMSIFQSDTSYSGEWFDNETVLYWNLFGGGAIIGVSEANMSGYGHAVDFFEESGITILKITNSSGDINIEYLDHKTFDYYITDFYVADVYGNDGYDDILVSYESTLEIINVKQMSLSENIDAIVCGNYDSDPEDECAILTDYPRIRIYDHNLNANLSISNQLQLGFDVLDMYSSDFDDDGRDEILVVRNDVAGNQFSIAKISESANIIYENISSGLILDAILVDIDMDGEAERLVAVENISNSYKIVYYDEELVPENRQDNFIYYKFDPTSFIKLLYPD